MRPDTFFDNAPAGTLRLLQITDPHIFSSPHDRLLGVDTRDSLRQVIQRVNVERQPLDAALLTGDIVHDEGNEGYAAVRHILEQLPAPVYCLPGNHDERTKMALLDRGNSHTTKQVLLGDWQIILLDSVLENEEAGFLSDDELNFLQQALEAHPDRHALIGLHHHPVPIGSAWMDNIRLRNGNEFLALLGKYPQARGVIWGHIHQEFESRRDGLHLLGSPSTCIQFEPGNDDFAIDPQPPGFRWLALLPNGAIRTTVLRVANVASTLELSSDGY